MADDGFSDFPSWALLPKRETNVSNFLNKYPTYDGRGIKIAVFDSGIDPGAPGLQKTSVGTPKICDMMDATGAGDVDTSTVVEAIDGKITGLTGRSLKIPSSWSNPMNRYHIGVKNGFELYPKFLKDRILKEQREKLWDPVQKQLLANATRKLQEFNDEFPVASHMTIENKLYKEELEASVEMLNSMEKKFINYGPTYDCVVFHDGNTWRAVVDASETGDLKSCKLLSTYSETHEYATLSVNDMLNFVVNIHEGGNLLEIVAVASNHGTHVASITAAYFPDDPEKCGIAPGAQIVSITIGDIRLGSMETGAALTRALIKVIESKCDVINISYGEPSHWYGGRLVELLHDIVDKYGVIVVCSAGNRGPALSTVNKPPVMHNSIIIGAGAYVSPDMMVAEYSLREKIPGMGYTWTSRGPGMQGELSVCVCAPGGAITSVPNYMLRGSQLLNGTSMSSPHIAGCIALLLSGLRAKNIHFSPHNVRRAIENTALKVHSYEPFSMGHGLIQVDKAFEHLLQYSNCMERLVRFNVTCDSKRGVYLRESFETKRPHNSLIVVEPVFLDNLNADPLKKIAFHMNFKLVCDVPWVSLPSHLSLMYTTRSFVIRVDPCGLPPGEHFTWIKAFDTNCVDKGPVFNIPITVIKSTMITEANNWEFKSTSCLLKPGRVVRQFLDVPQGATYAVFKIRSQDAVNDATSVVHAIQLRPQLSCTTHEFHKMIRLGPKEETEHVFEVQERRVLELDVVKWWTGPESLLVDYSISFHGLKPESSQIHVHAANGVHRFDVTSLLRYEVMLPSASLKMHIMVVRPSENKITPLKQRDVIPEGRQVYEIQLTYNFNISKATEVTPSCSLLSDLLYESEYESQLWMLFDSNKQLAACGDAFPNKYCTKLEKGEYVLKLQVRHEQQSLLERLSDMPLLLQMKLPSTITMDVYDKHSQALIGGKKAIMKIVPPDSTVPLFLSPLPSDKLPKSCSPGHYLLGSISFVKEEAVKKVNTYPLKYYITEAPKKSNSGKANLDKEKEKSVDEEYQEAIRDLKLSWMPKLDNEACKGTFNSLTFAEPNYVPIVIARMQYLEQNEDPAKSFPEIMSLADKVLDAICSKDLLAYFGSKVDRKDATHKVSERQKNHLIEALIRKGVSLCDYVGQKEQAMVDKTNGLKNPDAMGEGETHSEPNVPTEGETNDSLPDYSRKDIAEVHSELLKWVDTYDLKVASFTKRYAKFLNHPARTLKLLFKQLEEKPSLEIEKECIEMYRKLGWSHVAYFSERSLLVKYPLSYRLF